MSEHETGQIAASAADVYEQFFVPALFADWPPRVLRAAGVTSGNKVLDVACGTGVLARAAQAQVGTAGEVVGCDINPGMLAVAKRHTAGLTWREAAAEALPFPNNSFDRVVSQFGLMFFTDRVKALQEMQRVLKADGGGAVAVWATLGQTPGYQAVARMLADLYGADIARSIEAPYALGQVADLAALAEAAGLTDVKIETHPGQVHFPSLEAWLYSDIRGWTLADVIDDEGYAVLQQRAPEYLGAFVQADGSVRFDSPANILSFSGGSA